MIKHINIIIVDPLSGRPSIIFSGTEILSVASLHVVCVSDVVLVDVFLVAATAAGVDWVDNETVVVVVETNLVASSDSSIATSASAF